MLTPTESPRWSPRARPYPVCLMSPTTVYNEATLWPPDV